MDAQLIKQLMTPHAFPHAADDLQLIETHISWIVLAGEFAYKIKKPIRNNFLDYTSPPARRGYCEAELRLNRRFAAELYLDVVSITDDQGRISVDGPGEPIESAVRMRRFPADALMSRRLANGLVQTQDVRSLAARISTFHSQAMAANPKSLYGSPEEIYREAQDNLRDIVRSPMLGALGPGAEELVIEIEQWTNAHFEEHRGLFASRKQQGHVRECHGDLHLDNIVWWHNEFIPFDGIEFCEEFRWIDTLSDAAFAAMDLAACQHQELSRSFINAYFENTGDYEAVRVIDWYLVFRAMVRAKVAALRALQLRSADTAHAVAIADIQQHLRLASQLISRSGCQRALWITHGVSGSGKTTGSEHIVQTYGAFRLRADVERKRNKPADTDLYTAEMTHANYERLCQLAEQLLRSGMGVIVDATFLNKSLRCLFRELADRLQVPFHILHFEADEATLQARIAQRTREGLDASEADSDVLRRQLESQEPLDSDELALVLRPK